jgi:hypothetical protein
MIYFSFIVCTVLSAMPIYFLHRRILSTPLSRELARQALLPRPAAFEVLTPSQRDYSLTDIFPSRFQHGLR